MRLGNAHRRKKRGNDRRRALIACLVLAALLGVGLLVGGIVPSPLTRTTPPAARDGNHLATGPVLFVPPSGNRCRQRVIDNATWLMRDNGEVDCEAVLSPQMGAVPREGSPARVDVIREIFRKK
jgi:hypothetical protein